MTILQKGIYSLFEKKEWNRVLESVLPFTQVCDIAIVNFETTVKSETAVPMRKCGPNLSAPPESVGALKYAGFNVVTLANNHFYDYGMEGMQVSLRLFDERGAGLKDTWYEGYMVVLDFEKDKLRYEIVPYRQCDGKPGVHPFSDTKELKSFQAKFDELNGIICNRDHLEDCQRKYYSDRSKAALQYLSLGEVGL